MDFNNVFEAFTFTLAHGLTIQARGNWELNDAHQLNLGISSPVFVLLVRPPYSGYDNELERNLERPLRLITNNGKWTSWNDLLMVNLKLRHQYQINDKFAAAFSYDFMVQSLSRVKHYNHLFAIGLTYKFQKNEK